jgi:hypothetical protein
MRALLDPATRRRLGANARRAVMPLSPAAITLQLVLLYRDLLAAAVQAKATRRGKRRPKADAEAPSSAGDAETLRPEAAAPIPTPAPPLGNAPPPDAPAVSAAAVKPTSGDAASSPRSSPSGAAPDEIPPR